MENFNYKKISPWEKLKVKKQLAEQLKAIFEKIIRDENLSDNEKEFLKLLSRSDHKCGK